MTPAAVLRVLVMVDGMAKTAAQVKALDKDLEKAGDASDSFATDLEKARKAARQLGSDASSAGGNVRGMGGDADKAAKKVSGLTSDMAKATKATDLWRDSAGRWRNSIGQFATDAEKAAAGIDDLDKKNRKGAGGIAFIRQGITALGGAFGKLTGSLVGMFPLLVAVSGALFAIGAALGPLVGLGAAAAVGLLAAAQAFGVLKLATMGVGDALKEQLTAHTGAAKAAITGAGQQRAAARAIESAQEGVRTANDAVRRSAEGVQSALRAQKEATAGLSQAIRDARTRLVDLREGLVDADLALRGARQSAQGARDALASLLSGPDPRALAEAHNDVTDALRGEERAALALTDAHEALNALLAGPDPLDVADAHDRVQDALRGEEHAAADLADQVKRTNAVLNNPTSSDADKAKARLDLADAENAVGDSKRETAKAQRDLAKLEAGPSQQEIAKARLDVRDAEDAVGDAKRGTTDAQLALAKLEAGPSQQEIAAARLAVAQAENAVGDAIRDRARAQRDLNKAERLGVKGAEEVVAARLAIGDAAKGVTDAERGLADAHRDVARASQAVADAQLSAKESAAGAAIAAADLNEKFNALPPAAQAFVRVLQSLKPRLDEIRGVAAAGLFPGVTAGLNAAMGSFDSVKKVTGETATVLGGLATKAGELVGSKGFGKDLETIGHRNAIVIDRVGRAALFLVDALRHVLVAAGPLTTWLAKVTVGWAQSAAKAAKAGRETGKLGEFFHSTRKTLVRVASIIGNVATAFYEMGKSAAPSGRSLLKSLDEVTAKFAAWTKSIGGQRALQEFFEESTKLSKSLMPALGGVLASVGSLAFHVMPAYVAILEALGPLAGPLIQMFILYKLALTGVAIATNLVAAAQWLWNAAMSANPIALVVIAIAALVAGIIVAYHESETFRKIVDGAWDLIKKVAAWLVTAGVDAFNAVAGAVKAAWNAIKTATQTVWGAIDGYLKGIWTGLKTAIGLYFGAYKLIVTTAWNAIKLVTETVWAVISTVATGAWSALKMAADTAWDLIKLAILSPIRAARDIIGGKDGIWGQIKSVAVDAWEGIKTAISKAADPILGVITAPFKEAVKQVARFAKLILQVVGKIPGVDTEGAVKSIDKFVDGLKEGGTFKAFARGGAFARTGGVVSSPITLMGEEAPRHPEFVIPTNPAYRDRAQALLGQAAGAIGLFDGGVVSTALGVAKHVNASPKSQVALMEAGIVESGMRNLPYGDADSRGFLQIRDSTAAGMGIDNMNVAQSALAFLTRGFWGKGSAMSLAANNPKQSAGWVAQQTQGSAFPDRYDQVFGQATALLKGKGAGNIGDLLAGAADALNPMKLIGKLPGVGDLPEWLKGTGKWVLDKVGDYIKGALLGGSGHPGAGGGGSGKVVQVGQWLQSLGYQVSEHPSFGGVTPGVHAADGYHPIGRAIDVNWEPVSEEMAKLDRIVPVLRGMNPAELLWRVKDHFDHLHVAFKRGGEFGGLPFAGSFGGGGIVGGPLGSAQAAIVHGGERITPPGEGGVDVHLHFAEGMSWLRDFIQVEIVERDRKSAGAYRAGLVSS